MLRVTHIIGLHRTRAAGTGKMYWPPAFACVRWMHEQLPLTYLVYMTFKMRIHTNFEMHTAKNKTAEGREI